MSDNKNFSEIQKNTIKEIFEQREKFIIIGLTGKIGSGCSTVAKQCEKSFRELKLSCPQPPANGKWDDSQRDSRIIQRFYSYHIEEKLFFVIKVRNVILSFILEDSNVFKRFKNEKKDKDKEYPKKIVEVIERAFKEICETLSSEEYKCIKEYIGQHLQKAGEATDKTYVLQYKMEEIFVLNQLSRERKTDSNILRFNYIFRILPYIGEKIHEYIKEDYTELFQNYGNELRFFGTLDKSKWETGSGENLSGNLYTISERINCFIKAVEYRNGEDKETTFVVIDSMKNIYESTYLKDRYSSYYLMSVSKEENLRKEDIHRNKPYYSEEDIQYLDYNERPNESRKKFEKFVRVLQHNLGIVNSDQEEDKDVTANKGILKELISQICSENFYTLLEKLKENNMDSLINNSELDSIIWDEKFQKEGIQEDLFKYYKRILKDPLRMFIYCVKLHQIYLQDVESCIQSADIFLANNETTEETHRLNLNIIRYISLMLHPGLVTPTEVERCMQIAYAAKVNSGCISRQVGAVVTDAQYNILSLGWNDVPCGQVSCNRRNIFDLARALDGLAYSNYENGPRTMFRDEINRYGLDKRNAKSISDILGGLPAAFCFKDIQEKVTGDKNPMDARSMHGEEKALLACDQQRVQGGYLFTTSSPCEMCAKNAKDHHIAKIYYIEPYPGISQSHICDSGDEDNRAQYVLFEGAIGRAYTQLYTPVMPYKDELKLRGLDELKKSHIDKKGDKEDEKEDEK